ncbi:MAG: hypothetical protein IKR95_06420 [Oscillospiraceae bacterium]|jgi:hypothetical protein|nr:hypothetical protein [Oscillospiraceae bacterium]
MNTGDILKLDGITPAVYDGDSDVNGVFCCDLLSVAMARAPEGSAWVTVMTNANVVAVASLAEVACVVLAEGFEYDEAALNAARGKVTLLRSNEPVYETAVKIGALL